MSDVPITTVPLEFSAPFSLFIDLKPGTKADLEVVANTSLALAAAARELAYILDPSLSVRMELVGGQDGSLWLDTKLRALGITSQGQTLSVGLIAGALAMLLFNNVAGTAIQDLIHTYLWSATSSPPFTQEMMDNAVNKAIEKVQAGAAKKESKAIYHAISKDENITGVGAGHIDHKRPEFVVPREQFAIRSGASDDDGPLPEKRDYERPLRVTVVKPVLYFDPKKERSWRFSLAGEEFGAKMLDKKFAHDVALGFYSVRLKSGIELDVLMQIKEERKNGAYEIYERNVIAVYDIVSQGQRLLPFSGEAEPDDTNEPSPR